MKTSKKNYYKRWFRLKWCFLFSKNPQKMCFLAKKTRGASDFSSNFIYFWWNLSILLSEKLDCALRTKLDHAGTTPIQINHEIEEKRHNFSKNCKFASQKRCFLCDAKWQIFEKSKFFENWTPRIVENVIFY